MHVRAIDWAIIAVSGAFGAALPPGTFEGDTGKLLITFLGLVSAGILPTISLVLGSMSASGRSVLAIDELERELSAAMNALLALFGLGVAVVGALLVLSLPLDLWATGLPTFVAPSVDRFAQGVIAAGTALMLTKAGQVSGIMKRSLGIRHRIAVDEARRKILEKAPTASAVREAFPTSPDYGRTTKVG